MFGKFRWFFFISFSGLVIVYAFTPKKKDFKVERDSEGDFRIPPPQLPDQMQNIDLPVDDKAVDIPATKFIQHVREKKSGGKKNLFLEEYQFIENQSDKFQYDNTSSLLVVNKLKNRYANILAHETSRVLLKSIDGLAGSDYINANYLNGFVPGSERAYICTQGPVLASIGDFWRMVWESNASVIVMLTKDIEKGMIKCDEYWPAKADQPLLVGYFSIKQVSVKIISSEVIQKEFEVFYSETNQTRIITHSQYIGWPDHGLPSSAEGFLKLVDDVDTFNYTHAPLVVHCSAGIGRSGTFCAVHAIVQKLKLDVKQNPHEIPNINVVKAVLEHRKQRAGLVQTGDQYTFVNLAVAAKCEELLQNLRQS